MSLDLVKKSSTRRQRPSGARFSVQPWASAHGLAVISGWRAEARHSTLKRAPRRPLAMLFLYKPLVLCCTRLLPRLSPIQALTSAQTRTRRLAGTSRLAVPRRAATAFPRFGDYASG